MISKDNILPGNSEADWHPVRRFQILNELIGRTCTDVACIRPAFGSTEQTLKDFGQQLIDQNIIPVFLPLREQDQFGDDRFFPTDQFRQVGELILADIQIDLLLDFLATVLSEEQIQNIKERIVLFKALSGGNYVSLAAHKLLLFSQSNETAIIKDQQKRQLATDEIRKIFYTLLVEDGWKVIELDTKPIHLSPYIGLPDDLDLYVSLFEGMDGLPHALVAQSFAPYMPEGIILHSIPDQEAMKGGCNVADIKQGQILIPVNAQDAPTAVRILKQQAKAVIIEAPPGFYEYGDYGPRCSISGLSL